MELTLLHSRTESLQKHIRKFNKLTDLILLRKLIHKSIEVCYPAFYDDEAVRYYKEHHQVEDILKRSTEGTTIVCTIKSKIVGSGTITDNKIHAIFTDPSLQHKGIGKLIVNSLLLEASYQGLSSVIVEATPGSRLFFDKFGFNMIKEEIVNIGIMDTFNYFIMEKTLN